MAMKLPFTPLQNGFHCLSKELEIHPFADSNFCGHFLIVAIEVALNWRRGRVL
jgi:hypothetical protein